MRVRVAVSIVLVSALSAQADIFVEIDHASGGPDGITMGDAVMGSPEDLSVWIWADAPGAFISTISMTLDGRSEAGVLGSGGLYELAGSGIADPDNVFWGVLNHGDQTDPYTIENINIFASFPPNDFELPVGMNNAIVLYTNITGTAWSVGAGVMPDVIVTSLTGPTLPIQTFGIYQTPAPGTLALLACASCALSRRRRATIREFN